MDSFCYSYTVPTGTLICSLMVRCTFLVWMHKLFASLHFTWMCANATFNSFQLDGIYGQNSDTLRVLCILIFPSVKLLLPHLALVACLILRNLITHAEIMDHTIYIVRHFGV